MKKYFAFFLALCAGLAVSCNTEPLQIDIENANQAGMKAVSITANIDDVTKTSYTGAGVFSWTAGDEISVLCTDGNFYTFTAASTAASSVFNGSIPEGESLGDRAFFPADAGHDLGGYKYNIPETKDLTSHPSAEIPMIATKGEGNVYSFTHCCGAVQLQLTNIPASIKSVLVTVSHPSLKLSGLFGVFTSEGYWRWNPAGASTESEKVFSRKVAVSDNTASVYIPYASGSDWWGTNTLDVVGYDSVDTPFDLVLGKAMKSIGATARATVTPLKPLVMSQLRFIDWSGVGVNTSVVDPGSPKQGLSELKVVTDPYYMYARVKSPVEGFVGTHLDVYLSDGAGEHYSIADDNQYWTTGGETIYRQEHQGTVTTTSLALTFNGKSVDTYTVNDGTNIYWHIAFPRSAHTLLTSGTVYVSFMLWNGWGCYGAIPTRYTAMMAVAL